jgi:hypothetical protein
MVKKQSEPVVALLEQYELAPHRDKMSSGSGNSGQDGRHSLGLK